jgi:hypothetical protein
LYLLGDKSPAFVEAAFRHARERQNLFPGYLELDEFKRDLNLYHQLKQVQEFFKPLAEKVIDTTRGGRFRGFFGSLHLLQGGAGCLGQRCCVFRAAMPLPRIWVDGLPMPGGKGCILTASKTGTPHDLL